MLKFTFPQKKWQLILITIVFLVLFLISGFRDGSGTDYSNYQYLFYSYINGGSDWKRLEIGFQLIFKFIKFFSDNDRYFFVITSFLILFLNTLGFLKYSRSTLLSIFLFVTFYYFFNSWNGIRQFLAMSLILCFSTKYLAERNILKYVVSVLFASLFHVSALFMLPAYFANKKLNIRHILFLVLLIPFLFLMFDFVSPWIFSISGSYAVYTNYKAGSVSAFLLVESCFFIIILIAYRNNKNWTGVEIISFNLALISFIFLVLSYKNIMFYRMAIYYGMYFFIIIPAALSSFSKRNNKTVVYVATVVLGGINLSYHLYNNVSDVFPYSLGF